ncbi:MAG TPA: aminotransferase class IV [Dehalococcoidales bacterium]|nr:aminotransferase class IV [Dehalococcoidales bacterium]
MKEIFYLNGKLVPREEAKISLLDYGFLFGFGLYETIRAYDGKPFRLENHLARLRYSGDRLGIKIYPALIREAVYEVIKANGFGQTRLRICVSIGEGEISPDLDSCKTPTIAVIASEYKPPTGKKYQSGYKAVLSSIRRNSLSPVTSLKSANTIESMLARRDARDVGADEALFLNEKGYLTEATGSNVFIVKEGVLKTPPYESGILPGVTRVIVFESAAQLGIKVREVNCRLADLTQADEVFVTNSLIEIMPVTSFAGQPVGNGKAGTLTRNLMKAYRELVRNETSEIK